MECDACGRYLPSRQIGPLLGPPGQVVMACGRGRRKIASWRPPAQHDGVPLASRRELAPTLAR